MNVHDVIRRPVVTEKSNIAREERNVVTLAVDPRANKNEIRNAVETLFDVKVVDVRTASVKSKPKRRGYTSGKTRSWKKAIVQVREGDSIPIFATLQGLEGE